MADTVHIELYIICALYMYCHLLGNINLLNLTHNSFMKSAWSTRQGKCTANWITLSILAWQPPCLPWSVTCKTWRDVQMRRSGLSSSAMSAAIPSRQLPGITAREGLTSQVHQSMDLRIVKTGGLAFINSVALTIWWSAYRAMNPTQEPTNVKPGTSCQQPASPCTWMSLVSCCEQWITCTCVVEQKCSHPNIHSLMEPSTLPPICYVLPFSSIYPPSILSSHW